MTLAACILTSLLTASTWLLVVQTRRVHRLQADRRRMDDRRWRGMVAAYRTN